MTTALIIISSIALVFSFMAFMFMYSKRVLIDAFVFAANQTLENLQTQYAYSQYFLASNKLMLENLEHVNADRMQQATVSEKYQDAAYYRDMITSIDKLRKMDPSDIEAYEEQPK